MPRQNAFHQALRTVRRMRGLSQEALGEHSSRTYVSTLERGLMSPTLSKIDQLADSLEVHPLTLLLLSYAGSASEADVKRVLAIVEHEVAAFYEGAKLPEGLVLPKAGRKKSSRAAGGRKR